MKWGVTVRQCDSVTVVPINSPARAHMYIFWKSTVTLSHCHTSDFLFPLHALPYTYPKQYDY